MKELIELCQQAHLNQLEKDPDCVNVDINKQTHDKLKKVTGVIKHPDTLYGSAEFTDLPNIDQFDIYNYLIAYKDNYDHKMLKSFKNLDGYQLYKAGYVEDIKFCKNAGVQDFAVIKFLVKPKQRKEDPINKVPFYKGWIVLDCATPAIDSAYCACKGGADGSYRHVVATLFEINEHSQEETKTSGPCQWTKKARVNEDIPVQITNLNTALAGSKPKDAPLVDAFHLPLEVTPDYDAFYSGLKILYPDANILLNRYTNRYI